MLPVLLYTDTIVGQSLLIGLSQTSQFKILNLITFLPLELRAPSGTVGHPVIASALVPVHEALGGTGAHILEATHGPPAGEVMAHHHTDEGLAAPHASVLAALNDSVHSAHHAGGLAALRTSALAALRASVHAALLAAGPGHQATAVVGALLHGALDE